MAEHGLAEVRDLPLPLVGHSLEEDVGSTHITEDDGLVARSPELRQCREAVFWCQLISVMYIYACRRFMSRSKLCG